MKEILEFLQSGNVAWAFVTIAVLWASKLDILKVFDLRRLNKDKEIESLEKIVSSDHFDEAYKEVMKKRLAELLFEKHFGIVADETKRNALINFHMNNAKEATWLIIKRAAPYINVNDNNEIHVEIKRSHKAEKYFNLGVTLFIGGYALLLFIVGILSQWSEGKGVIQFGALALGIFVVAMFFSTMNWPYQAAEKIKDLVQKNA
jgi:hypothetical protein